ncbi:MAG: ubiquinol-cytochrome c reductase iron-sulfur subunit N-terminal domain-containing protein, partial [Holosporales bacterium]
MTILKVSMTDANTPSSNEPTRRDFLSLTAGAVGVAGVACAAV